MNTYAYTAEQGSETVKGEIEAASAKDAIADLQDAGYTSVEINGLAKKEKQELIEVNNPSDLSSLPAEVRDELLERTGAILSADLTVGKQREQERQVLKEVVNRKTGRRSLVPLLDDDGNPVTERVMTPGLTIDAGSQQPGVTVKKLVYDAATKKIAHMEAECDEWPPRGEGF